MLNVLFVALQPILARARRRALVHRLRVTVAADESIDLTVEASDLAAAASKAIRTVACDGHRVVSLEVAGGIAECTKPRRRARVPES